MLTFKEFHIRLDEVLDSSEKVASYLKKAKRSREYERGHEMNFDKVARRYKGMSMAFSKQRRKETE